MKFEAPNQSWHDNSWKTKIFNLSLTDWLLGKIKSTQPEMSWFQDLASQYSSRLSKQS
jgi:hypothetical protein